MFDLRMPRPATGLVPGDVVLTGDRPTGPLHLGHLAGSLAARVAGQDLCPHTVLVADLQALTDHAQDVGRVRASVDEVMLDYAAVGLDPTKVRFCLQSEVPELAEITVLLLNLTSLERILRNPTVKAEAGQKGDRARNAGFAVYPASQAADILGFAATAVPVGRDQAPMLELASHLADQLALRGCSLPVPRPVFPEGGSGRLPGVDGRKASKTLGNAIALGASDADIAIAVRRMVSDASRTGPSDPGDPDKPIAFAYLRAFDTDRNGLSELEAAYRRGGVRDGDVKARAETVVRERVGPIRDRRGTGPGERSALRDVLRDGTAAARVDAVRALDEIRACFGLARRAA
jgi:tryptophanyl-tRNA synthetase